MRKAQRIIDGHEKKVQEAKLINTETWAGPHDSSGILVLFTDSFGNRHKNFCPLQPGTLN